MKVQGGSHEGGKDLSSNRLYSVLQNKLFLVISISTIIFQDSSTPFLDNCHIVSYDLEWSFIALEHLHFWLLRERCRRIVLQEGVLNHFCVMNSFGNTVKLMMERGHL